MTDQEIHGRPVPFYHSATTSGEDHISIHIEKKHHPTRSEEEQTVEMICRPNSKGTPFIDVYLICVLCSLFFALYAQILIFQVSSTHILIS
jgi:hypothetical protein